MVKLIYFEVNIIELVPGKGPYQALCINYRVKKTKASKESEPNPETKDQLPRKSLDIPVLIRRI